MASIRYICNLEKKADVFGMMPTHSYFSLRDIKYN